MKTGPIPVSRPQQAPSGCLLEPDACPSAVLVDKHNPGPLKGAPNNVERGAPRLSGPGLELMHRYYSYARLFSELVLLPLQQRTSCPALCRCNGPKSCFRFLMHM